MSAFLTPSKYVRFSENSDVSSLAYELLAKRPGQSTLNNRLWILSHVHYDYIKAIRACSHKVTIKDFVPDLDKIIKTGRGICFDYAALFAALCRLQGIPCKLILGMADRRRHAWNMVLLDKVWYLLDLTYIQQNRNVKKYAPLYEE